MGVMKSIHEVMDERLNSELTMKQCIQKGDTARGACVRDERC